MDLNPNFENLRRPVLFLLAVVLLSYAFFENRYTSGDYWLSEVPVVAALLTAAIYWQLRKEVWFWSIIFVAVVVQGGLSILFPVPLITPSSPILLVLVCLDLVLLAGCIRLIGGIASKRGEF
jgi:hypothetical protein